MSKNGVRERLEGTSTMNIQISNSQSHYPLSISSVFVPFLLKTSGLLRLAVWRGDTSVRRGWTSTLNHPA